MGSRLPLRVTAWLGGQVRTVSIVVGRRYEVVPMNVRKQKHRGRFCVVVGLAEDEWQQGPPDRVVVRFEDTGRLGRVDPSDLLSAEGMV